MTIIVNLETAIQELNNGTIEFHYPNDNGCTTESEIIILLNRLQQYENSGFPLETLQSIHTTTKPVTVKDFKTNNTAYIVHTPTYRDNEYHIKETIVEKVGKKYVYTSLYQKYEQVDWCIYGLNQSNTSRDKALLFPTKEAAEKYIEYRKLKIWFSNTQYIAKQYSLEQLRLVKQILER